MNSLTKTAAVALATLTIAVGTFGTSSDAHAFSKKKLGVGIAAGLAATVVGAMIHAASKPSYAAAAPECRTKQRFDQYGNYRGTVQICDMD
jgi:hypothetical protein